MSAIRCSKLFASFLLVTICVGPILAGCSSSASSHTPRSVSTTEPTATPKQSVGTITELPFPEKQYLSDFPTWITVGPDHQLWFTIQTDTVDGSFAGGKIGTLTSSGQTVEYPLPNSNDAIPYSIVTGADGNLWFTYSHIATATQQYSGIEKISPSGTFSQVQLPNPYCTIRPLVAAHDGNIWFTELCGKPYPSAASIGRISPTGVVTDYAVPNPNAYYLRLGSLVSAPDGTLWSSEIMYASSSDIIPIGSQILNITLAGTVKQYPLPNAHVAAGDVGVAPDGSIVFSQLTILGSHETSPGHTGFTTSPTTVSRLTPAGQWSTVATFNAGDGANDFITGPDGNLWFLKVTMVSSDQYTRQLVRLSGHGDATTFALPMNIIAQGLMVGPDNAIWFTETSLQNYQGKLVRIQVT